MRILVASAMPPTPCGRTTVGDRGAVRVLAEFAGAWTTVGLSASWPNWLGHGRQWGYPRPGRIGWAMDDSEAVHALAELAGTWTAVELSTPWTNWLGRGQQCGCPRLGRIGWGVNDSGARAIVWIYVSGGYRNVTL